VEERGDATSALGLFQILYSALAVNSVTLCCAFAENDGNI
jgi:hypothetical protein